VHEYLNGRMVIMSANSRLVFKPIEAMPPKIVIRKVKPRFRPVPQKGSYWRDGFKLRGSLRTN